MNPNEDIVTKSIIMLDFEPHGRRKRGDFEMREVIIKLSVVAAFCLLVLGIFACDVEEWPVWIPLLMMLAPLGYIALVGHANHWGY